MILRHADVGGQPISNSECCRAHARASIERDRAAGLQRRSRGGYIAAEELAFSLILL